VSGDIGTTLPAQGDSMSDADDSYRAVKKDDCTMAMLCHLGGIMGFIIPLILWLVKNDESRFIDYHGKEALNFRLTMLIGHLPITFSVIAGMAASRGEWYRYPLSIRFIS
jgi:uncharacterized Tic20 family protein